MATMRTRLMENSAKRSQCVREKLLKQLSLNRGRSNTALPRKLSGFKRGVDESARGFSNQA